MQFAVVCICGGGGNTCACIKRTVAYWVMKLYRVSCIRTSSRNLLPTSPPYCPNLHPIAHISTVLPTSPPSCPHLHRIAHVSTLLPASPPYCPHLYPTAHISALKMEATGSSGTSETTQHNHLTAIFGPLFYMNTIPCSVNSNWRPETIW
jgi:hypothetical protein